MHRFSSSMTSRAKSKPRRRPVNESSETRQLYAAFDKAKKDWLAKLDAGELSDKNSTKYLALRKIVGHDPLPFGIDANRKTIEALEATAFKQGLTPRRMSIDELFVDPQA
ncbi:hypothetical protein L0Z26_00925 [Burkholderia multivorans]|nr:hypothetical protein [Burkholderia multivorans]MCO1340505.1 hypothetical protein [Burkholderia multivorans]MCO1440323.1 hypothetical protein [Burkholderia multivorans]UQO30900.1 hypothetical protein L0Z21_25525 [Burkholderia multivorans]UQO44026.1 hypothetical protein L0Z43_25260 [Burkholderia multivorans]